MNDASPRGGVETQAVATPNDDALRSLLNRPLTDWVNGAVIARLTRIDPDGSLWIEIAPGSGGRPLRAETCVALDRASIGSELIVVLAGGDSYRPIVMGVLRALRLAAGPSEGAANAAGLRHVHIDGDRLVISAEREIEIRCGDASITLTRAGKLLIQGLYVSSRSVGVNRIRGGTVEIN